MKWGLTKHQAAAKGSYSIHSTTQADIAENNNTQSQSDHLESHKSFR